MPAPSDAVFCLGVPRRMGHEKVSDVVSDPTVIKVSSSGLLAFEKSWGQAIWDTAAIVAADLGQLRWATPVLASAGSARRVVVHVAVVPPWRARQPFRFPAGTLTSAVRMAPDGSGRWDATFDAPILIWDVVLALRSTDRRPAAAGALRVVVGDRGALDWTVDDPRVPTLANTGRTWRGSRRPFVDVVLETVDRGRQHGPAGVPIVALADRCPPVDPVVCNPGEFRREPVGEPGTLTLDPAATRIRVRMRARPLVTVGLNTPLVARAIAALRELRHLDVTAALTDDLWAGSPVAAATTLTRLAAAGVPLVTGPMPAPVSALLHPDIVTAFASVREDHTVEPIAREAVAVRQRRAVLRHFSPMAAWAAARPVPTLPAPHDHSVSVLAVTKRPELLHRAVAQAASQRNVSAEVVVVTHGFEPSPEVVARLRDLTPALTLRSAPASSTLGEALNLAVEAAAGDVVSKMDDDDWYGPHHLEDLLQAMDWSGATLVGVADEFSYLADRDVTVRHEFPPIRDYVDTRVAGPSMTIRRDDLRALGGWRPVPIHEDLALNNAIWHSGAVALRTHGLGYLRCRHGAGHTWTNDPDAFDAKAVERWPGFAPPPEVPADESALAYYRSLRPA